MNGGEPGPGVAGRPAGPAKSRELFQRSVERVDVAAGNRLRLMRRDALSRPARASRAWLLPAGVAALAVLLVSSALWLPRSPELIVRAAPDNAAVGDLAISADDDSELYAWLGDAPVAVDPMPGGTL